MAPRDTGRELELDSRIQFCLRLAYANDFTRDRIEKLRFNASAFMLQWFFVILELNSVEDFVYLRDLSYLGN